MSPTFSSLAFRNYRLWFLGALIANIGTWMQRVGQDWLVLTHLTDDSAVAVGVVTALQFIPMLVLSPWAGLLADRLPRRWLLAGTQAGQGVLAFALGGLVLTGRAELWHVYVFAALLGCVTAVDGPVRQTFVAEIVPKEQLSNAVGLNSASFNAGRLIGPGVAGVLIAVVDIGPVFIINGLSFAATILALVAMRPAELTPLPVVARGRGQIREGLAYVRRRTDILMVMVVVGVVSTIGMNHQLTLAVMARSEFGRDADAYGLLSSVLAVGSLVGALLAARRERPRVRLVIGSAFAFGVASGVLAIMPTFETFALATIPVGLAALTMMTAANATIQLGTSPALRGRVMALYMMVFLGSKPIGGPFVGWVAEVLGPRWSVGVGSVAALLVAGGAALWARKHWHVEVRYRVRPRPGLIIHHPADIEGAAGGEVVADDRTEQRRRQRVADELTTEQTSQAVNR